MSFLKIAPILLLTLTSKAEGQKLLNQTSFPWGYTFKEWKGPPVDVLFYFPPGATDKTPVLIVMPGVERDVQLYHSTWIKLSKEKLFILLTLGIRKKYFPDEYSYSAGRVVSSEGYAMHEDQWLFSAVEPMFKNFKKKHKIKTEKFHIFGSGPGAGFVHRYLLFKPNSPVSKAVSYNPSSVTLFDKEIQYPYGLKNTPQKDENIKIWLEKNHLIIANKESEEKQNNPFIKDLLGQVQGASGYERATLLYNSANQRAKKAKTQLNWKLIKISETGDSKHKDLDVARVASEFLFNQ